MSTDWRRRSRRRTRPGKQGVAPHSEIGLWTGLGPCDGSRIDIRPGRVCGGLPEVPTPEVHPAVDVDDGSGDPLLTAAQVAKILGIRPKAVYDLNIPHIELSPRRNRWRLSDLNVWINSRRAQ
jgi:predicted DNA-binding transcriptional regulator AlpA